MADQLMCPVCRARFRGASECSRCGADLTVVMTLAASAWRLRQAAREGLASGDFARARELALQAQEICHTPGGRRLEALSGWLAGQVS
jgi:hypothetical protein